MKKAIGGYFELELNRGREFHTNALCLNTGRNCLEYILRARGYKKVYLPCYICDTVIEPISRLNLRYELYAIDKSLTPIFDKGLEKDEALLYVNYFGIKGGAVKALLARFQNLIIDNTQAFFDRPVKGVDAFYSARKFFGVPDGAYLYTDARLDCGIEQDLSYKRMDHLVLRIDKSAEDGYRAFVKNDDSLTGRPMKTMSKLTHALLCNIDYKKARAQRRENFFILHERLKHRNELKIKAAGLSSPLAYPLLCPDGYKIKSELIGKRIFVPTYWKEVMKRAAEGSCEAYLTRNLVPLPIDHRYGGKDMRHIILSIER